MYTLLPLLQYRASSLHVIVCYYAGIGLTGIPVFNVNNNCSSGSTALMMARCLVMAGYECTMAVGELHHLLSKDTLAIVC